jgi:4-hydroxy-2-oxoheptanedioate aldolase
MPDSGKRSLKERLFDGEVLVGPACLSSSPDVIEIVGYAGFDWVFIDTEQPALGIDQDLQNLQRAADSANIASIIRVPQINLGEINKVLNMGTQGLWVPHVESAAEAQAAVDAALYPPLGHRGACPSIRVAQFGFIGWDEHVERSNANTLLTMTIETVEGLEHVEEIAAVPGVDSLCLGTFDLGVDMGLPSSAQYGDEHRWIDERLEAAGKRIQKACEDNGLIPATLAWSGDSMERWIDLGFRNIMFGLDLGLIQGAFAAHKATADAVLSRVKAAR